MQYMVWYFFMFGILAHMYFIYKAILGILRHGIRLRATTDSK